MEPLVCTTAFATFTPTVNTLACNNTPGSVIQVIIGTRSVATHPTLGALEDAQGTMLPFGMSMVLPANQQTHRRLVAPANVPPNPSVGALGLNAQP